MLNHAFVLLSVPCIDIVLGVNIQLNRRIHQTYIVGMYFYLISYM